MTSKVSSVLAAIDFLEDKALARSVAEPNVLTLSGEPATVVGVMPAGIEFPIFEELWQPLRLDVAAVEFRAGLASAELQKLVEQLCRARREAFRGEELAAAVAGVAAVCAACERSNLETVVAVAVLAFVIVSGPVAKRDPQAQVEEAVVLVRVVAGDTWVEHHLHGIDLLEQEVRDGLEFTITRWPEREVDPEEYFAMQGRFRPLLADETAMAEVRTNLDRQWDTLVSKHRASHPEPTPVT